jgi:AcrR family transcriptional regulator
MTQDHPPRPRRQANSRANGVATRKRILHTATSLFAAAGYEATSLRQVSSAADVDLATLKYHFGDKATLFAEVYRHGHEALLDHIEPVLAELAALQSPHQVEEHIDKLVAVVHDFLEGHLPFIRMVLYRILEDSTDITGLEEELQGIAIALIERAFAQLIARGLIRAVDVRALITLLVSSLPMWFVTGRVRKSWIGAPALDDPRQGRARSEAFLRDLLRQFLIPAQG